MFLELTIYLHNFRLVSLTELVLSRNQITEIPSTIGLMKNLRAFNLDENEVTCLPPDVSKLKKNFFIK